MKAHINYSFVMALGQRIGGRSPGDEGRLGGDLNAGGGDGPGSYLEAMLYHGRVALDEQPHPE